MKRVLLMIRKLWNGGGTETYVYTLAKALQRQGAQVGVFTAGGPWVGHFRSNGIRVHTVPRDGRAAERLSAVIRAYDYQALHANDGYSIRLIGRLNRRTPAVVMTLHGAYVSASDVRTAGRLARTVVAVTPRLAGYARACGVPAGKIRQIPNAVDTAVFRPSGPRAFRAGIPPRAFVVGYAGRFTFDKVALGKRIAGTLKRYAGGNPDVHALIAGRQSRQHVAGGTRSRVLGHVQRMERFYRSCDAVVGTARVAMEAMACGVPVVAIGHAGYKGIVTPRNSSALLNSNFGDHGREDNRWRIAYLIRDLYDIKTNRRAALGQAESLRQWVARRLSASSMASRIARYY